MDAMADTRHAWSDHALEQLSDAGVPVFISDIKGDISGLAAAT